MSLPTCPKCAKTDYRPEYESRALRPGERPPWPTRTGRLICNLCGHRWPINPEGAKP